MGLIWNVWRGLSDGFVAAPGAPVTALPWGNWGFALFATDANGLVHTAAGDPQRGIPAPWAPISDGLVAAPGTPVTALPWEQGFRLFITDSNGWISTAAGDPQQGFGQWGRVPGSRLRPGRW